MATIEYVLETLIDAERHLKLLTGAARVDEVIGAANSYLAGWSKDRIENLQKIDGGWGPFDYQERPEPILRVGDFARISDQLSRHCLALKEGGIEPTPDLLELDLFFALAKQGAETFPPVTPRPYTSTSRLCNFFSVNWLKAVPTACSFLYCMVSSRGGQRRHNSSILD